jgi:hypothetical protein
VADDPIFVDDVELAVQFVPDEHTDLDLMARNPRELGAGHYEIGIVIEGGFVPLWEYKGGHIADRVAAWKRNNPDAKLPGSRSRSSSKPAKAAGAAAGKPAADDTKPQTS